MVDTDMRYIIQELDAEIFLIAKSFHSFQNLPIPWKALATSGPFWAILVAHTCNNFGWYMLLVELPTYMKAILRFNISQVSDGELSLCPFDNHLINIPHSPHAECRVVGHSIFVFVDIQHHVE